MSDQNQESGQVNISDINASEVNTGPNVTGNVGGDVIGGDKISVGDITDSTVAIGRGATAIGKIVNFFTPTTEQQRELRNRQAMLTLVHNTWVKGVLESSLHNEVLIELDLEERQDAIDHPWEMELRRAGQANRNLLTDIKMATIFDAVGQNLLILGDPGSGKTTMLLELARETIARAREDDSQPIPVVFNLSSWNDSSQTIADWLVKELNTKYNIPKKIAQQWVANDALLLLLDGLDEVAESRRDACVTTINKFHQTHLVPLVVCSRIADYERLSTRLRLESAVFIKPLTPEKIDRYLSDDSLELEAVRATLQGDKPIQELAQTPLMLSIMTLAYQGVSIEDLRQFNTVEARRKHLFDAYIKRMFERRGIISADLRKQTIKWLGWLAQRMVKFSQTEYLIERMQPDWLETRRRKWVYRLSVGLIGGLIIGLSVGLIGGLSVGLNVGLSIGLIGGLIFGVLDELRDIEPLEVLGWSWNKAKGGLFIGLIFALFSGLLCALLERVAFMLLSGLPTNRLLREGLFVGLSTALFLGLIFGVFFGPLGALFGGLVGGSKSIEIRVIPNQGIWQSGKNGVIVGLLGGLIFALIVVIYVELIQWLLSGTLVGGLFYGLFFGLLFVGLIFGLFVGSRAFFQHFSLRFVFWRTGQLPWRLVPFLDQAADLIFLRKVGGGYIFIHRLLMEHFAAMGAGELTAEK